jgi:hypothetical protein
MGSMDKLNIVTKNVDVFEILGTGAAVDVAGVARGATENAVCDVVGQLSDPLEGHVIYS